MTDTELPGSMLSLTMRSFSATVQRLLGVTLLISTVASFVELVLDISLAPSLVGRLSGGKGGYSNGSQTSPCIRVRRLSPNSPTKLHGSQTGKVMGENFLST